MKFSSRAILFFSAVAALGGTSAAPPHYKEKSGDGYCRGIVAKLNLLGANIDSKVCVGNGGNGGGGKNPGNMSCPELVTVVVMEVEMEEAMEEAMEVEMEVAETELVTILWQS
ncbi:hypothetical protein K7432_018326 [Basidiobolus ranarum]|uniref:Uncharacterized protein n=1 Tax=Basidiobolus ranarum TaxID=34480 RepID=A0ABR2WCB9_9FUNG